MKIDFLDRDLVTEGTLVIGAFEGQKLQGIAADVDEKTGGSLSRAMTIKE